MKHAMMPTTCAVVMVAMGLTTFVHAAVIHVPDDFATIQEAITAAVDGDEIVLADGTHSGAGNKELEFQAKAITLRSVNGDREDCIIDLEGDGRFATFGAGDTAAIRSVTITNGDVGAATGGAAIVGAGSAPTFEDCIVRNCHGGTGGGAFYLANGSLTASACVLQGNTTEFDGGAVLGVGTDVSVVLVECQVLDNVAGRGGGVHLSTGILTVTDSCFANNEATTGGGGGLRTFDGARLTCTGTSFDGNRCVNNGGGLRADGSSPPSRISGCLFTDNEAGNNGGGAMFVNSAFEVSNCLFERNVAATVGGGVRFGFATAPFRNVAFVDNSASFGGGVGVEDSATPEFVNCLFAGNMAITGADGDPPASGGLDVYGATATLINCTFSGNSSEEFGGALSSSNEGDARLVNCVLWGDDAPTGPEIQVGYPGETGGTVTVSSSDVAGGEAGVSICCGGTLEWGGGNIDADPLFVDPIEVDYRLAPGSPAIDAADNTAVPKDVTNDIDGNPRFVDDPDTKDTGIGDPPLVDMGVHELQTCAADLDRNGVVDFGDILAVLTAWGPYEPCPPAIPEDIDHDCVVGFSDILIILSAWGPCA